MSMKWQLVPTDPALALDMGWAYIDAAQEAQPDQKWAFSHPGYRAMLAAAPQPPALGGEVPPLRVDTKHLGTHECVRAGGWNDCHDAFMAHVARLLARSEERHRLRDDLLEQVKGERDRMIQRTVELSPEVDRLTARAAELEVLSADQARNLKRVKREFVNMKAERDTLKARCEELEKVVKMLAADPGGSIRHYVNSIDHVLSKAAPAAKVRCDEQSELLDIWRTWLGASRESCDETGKALWDRITAVLDQAAPAAKCERCAASTVEHCDENNCGYLGSGNGAPAAKDGAQ